MLKPSWLSSKSSRKKLSCREIQDVVATDGSDEISYDASAPWTILVFGQPELNNHFLLYSMKFFCREGYANPNK